MFLRTFSITEKYLSTVLNKKLKADSGIVEKDKRGKHPPVNTTPLEVLKSVRSHIEKFPRYESHYSREKSKREYLGSEINITTMFRMYTDECDERGIQKCSEWKYREVFSKEFNLSFHPPTNDTCDICDKYMVLEKQSTAEEEKLNLAKMKESHLKEADNRYKLKAEDKIRSKGNAKETVVMMDMQKCLPTPSLKNCQSFYLRKLWVLNETIYDATSNESYCMMWDETIGARGGNEVASCVLKWCLKFLNSDTNYLTIWSDNCTGQNRNIMIALCYSWLV